VEESTQYLQQAVKLNRGRGRSGSSTSSAESQSGGLRGAQARRRPVPIARAKARYEESDYHAAKRLLDEVNGHTDDKVLQIT